MRVLLRSAPRNGAPSSFHARLRCGAMSRVSDCFFMPVGRALSRYVLVRLVYHPYSIRMSFIQGDQSYQGYRVVYPSHPGKADRAKVAEIARLNRCVKPPPLASSPSPTAYSDIALALEGRHHPQGRRLRLQGGSVQEGQDPHPRCHAKDSPPLKCRLECRAGCPSAVAL